MSRDVMPDRFMVVLALSAAVVTTSCDSAAPSSVFVVNNCSHDLMVRAGPRFQVEEVALSDFEEIAAGSSRNVEVHDGTAPEGLAEEVVFRVVRTDRSTIIVRPLAEVARSSPTSNAGENIVELTGELCLS